MKKISVIGAVLLSGFIILSGCSEQTAKKSTSGENKPDVSSESSSEELSEEEAETETSTELSDKFTGIQNSYAEILDINGLQIGSLNGVGEVTVTNSGIVYTSYTEKKTERSGNEKTEKLFEYHIYDSLTNEDNVIGSLKYPCEEAAYTRTELGNKLYSLALTGDLSDEDSDPLWLLELDTVSKSMHKYKISENGSRFTGMTASDGKLLILNHDQRSKLNDIVYEFDPQTRSTKQVLNFELSDNVGQSLRGIYSDSKNIYLLRLSFESGNQVQMFADTYSKDYIKQDENNITSMFTSAAGESLTAEDSASEIQQMVRHFFVFDERYMYYENFSFIRFIGSIADKELMPVTDTAFTASYGSGKPCYFVNSLYAHEDSTKNENELYEWIDQEFITTVFSPSDDYYISFVSRSSNGNELIVTEYAGSEEKDQHQPQIYFITAD